MKTIYYVCYFDAALHPSEQRFTGVSNVVKSKYTISKLQSLGYNVCVVSLSHTANGFKYSSSHFDVLDKNLAIKQFASFGFNSFLLRKSNLLFILLQAFFYLLFNVSTKDNVLLYHSLVSGIPLFCSKLFKKFSVILEFTEVYGSFISLSSLGRKWEQYIIANSDKFILSIDSLASFVDKRPFAINYGDYNITKQIADKYNDGRIHIVYAGILTQSKGVVNFIKSAKFLDENFVLHIIGYGNKSDISVIRDLISEYSTKSKASISYDGLLKGTEFLEYIQKCHYGICPQDISASYNNFSFPSKIITYLANGLNVISSPIESILNSEVGAYLFYLKGDTPEFIAEVLKSLDDKQMFNTRELLSNLDRDFIINLRQILE
ncbi:MAG: glycosyltransferase [Tannerellaceae bacterium]